MQPLARNVAGEIRCQFIILGEIRCQFIILARKDELTPDYPPTADSRMQIIGVFPSLVAATIHSLET